MPRYTITPWRHQRDLLEVRAQLYPQHTATPSTVPAPQQPTAPDTRRHAVDRILAWKLRGNLPHAVESTALLVDAILHHHHQQQPQPQPQPQTSPNDNNNITANDNPPPTPAPAPASTFAIRAVYSAAFSRFVTGFCDIGRSRSNALTPASMLEIARQIEMPAAFVGLRHEATHEELPALGRLVGASAEALEWLWGAYWSRLGPGEEEKEKGGGGGVGLGEVVGGIGRRGEEEEGGGDLSSVREEAGRLLRSYRGLRRAAFKRKRQNSREHRVEVETVARACGELCGGSEPRVNALVGVLVDEKLLLPSNRELGSAMGPAITLWAGLLDLLATNIPGFRPTLIRHCLSVLSSADAAAAANADQDADAEGLYLWTRHFLEAEGERGDVLALRWCCLYPGYWTRKLGEDILARSDEEFVHVWRGLFESSALRDADLVASESVPAYSQQEVELNASLDGVRGDSSVSNPNELAAGGWRRAIVPPSVPIGVVA
ncbi:hypothetical protein KC364_g12884 [Hortaea werneckii]|uniref:Las1-domain-containing protein n=1 Tax=Hortaea werneckii TaxID=91943 RepID=A0A3M7I441_HORWE|nr:hypothetical protein KC358_g13028 [Hortaea werneckii]KAI7446805.1 hypothetical protein KC364_g12884 [Hortaea werneckii]RMZ20254.1 hypothetical protein D0859_15748 [Hortaea werneckii]